MRALKKYCNTLTITFDLNLRQWSGKPASIKNISFSFDFGVGKKMGKKRKRVPEVLWRLFRKRAQSLECTIESLLPSSEKAMSLLVRDKDPLQYRKLLNQCFLVVSENAPPLSHFNPHSRWSQSQVSLSLSLSYLPTLYALHTLTQSLE